MGSKSKSGSSSRRSGSKSSSRRSGSGSGSRSYDGHGSLSADGVGYECETKYDCADPQICNEYGICELAPRSAEDARSRSKSKSGSHSSSRRSGSKSSSRRSGSHSYDGHGSEEEMMMAAEEKVLIGDEPLEMESIRDALLCFAVIVVLFAAYQL